MNRMPTQDRPSPNRPIASRKSQIADRPLPPAFSIVELLVVLGIIAILLAILVPVVGSVRASARDADTRNTLRSLESAIDRYYADYRGYPGPFSNVQIEADVGDIGDQFPFPTYTGSGDGTIRVVDRTAEGFVSPASLTSADLARVTMSENLVLGLLGGLRYDASVTGNPLSYDPSLVGRGPASLNVLRPGSGTPYFNTEKTLSWRNAAGVRTGAFRDELALAADLNGTPSVLDTIIPEFVDPMPSPMPILYLRARPTGSFSGTVSVDRNPVIVTDDNASSVAAYSLRQFLDYIPPSSNFVQDEPFRIGEGVSGWSRPQSATDDPKHGIRVVDGRTIGTFFEPPSDARTAWDAYSYFRNPTVGTDAEPRTHEPRGKDRYILIAAGGDRRYGTSDDITSFGSIGR